MTAAHIHSRAKLDPPAPIEIAKLARDVLAADRLVHALRFHYMDVNVGRNWHGSMHEALADLGAARRNGQPIVTAATKALAARLDDVAGPRRRSINAALRLADQGASNLLMAITRRNDSGYIQSITQVQRDPERREPILDEARQVLTGLSEKLMSEIAKNPEWTSLDQFDDDRPELHAAYVVVSGLEAHQDLAYGNDAYVSFGTIV